MITIKTENSKITNPDGTLFNGILEITPNTHFEYTETDGSRRKVSKNPIIVNIENGKIQNKNIAPTRNANHDIEQIYYKVRYKSGTKEFFEYWDIPADGPQEIEITEINTLQTSENDKTIYILHDHKNMGMLNEYNPDNFASSTHIHDDRYYTEIETDNLLSQKQDTLISGQSIKTIDGQSLLGSGDLQLKGLKAAPFLEYQNSENNEIIDITNLLFFWLGLNSEQIEPILGIPNNIASDIFSAIPKTSGYVLFDDPYYYITSDLGITIYNKQTQVTYEFYFPFFNNYKQYIFKYNNLIYFCDSRLNIIVYNPNTNSFKFFFSDMYSIFTEVPNFLNGYLVNCYQTYIHVSYFDNKFVELLPVSEVVYDSENDLSYIYCDTSDFSIGDTIYIHGASDDYFRSILNIENGALVVNKNVPSDIMICKANPIDISSDLLTWELPEEVVNSGCDAEGMIIYKVNNKYYTVLGGFKSQKFLYEIKSIDNTGITFEFKKFLGYFDRRSFYIQYFISDTNTNFIIDFIGYGGSGHVCILFPEAGEMYRISVPIPNEYSIFYQNMFIFNGFLFVNSLSLCLHLPSLKIIYKEN